jgi:hypothetical protein
MNGKITAALFRYQADSLIKVGQPERACQLYRKKLRSTPRLPENVRICLQRQLHNIEVTLIAKSASVETKENENRKNMHINYVSSDNRRKGERCKFRTLMNVTFPKIRLNQTVLIIKGFSQDLSLTGVSFIPERNCGFLWNPDSLVDHRVYVKILADGISVEVMGKVIRTQKVIADGCKLMCFGIQFAEISPQMRWIIFSFAAIVDIGPSR